MHILLTGYTNKVGSDVAGIIMAISKGTFTSYFISFILGIVIGYFLMILTFKYNKNDLLIDYYERIEKLENEIKELKKI